MRLQFVRLSILDWHNMNTSTLSVLCFLPWTWTSAMDWSYGTNLWKVALCGMGRIYLVPFCATRKHHTLPMVLRRVTDSDLLPEIMSVFDSHATKQPASSFIPLIDSTAKIQIQVRFRHFWCNHPMPLIFFTSIGLWDNRRYTTRHSNRSNKRRSRYGPVFALFLFVFNFRYLGYSNSVLLLVTFENEDKF